MDDPSNACIWLLKISPHYNFYYKSSTLADRDIDSIVKLQESCYREITETLRIRIKNRITYYLCQTKKEVSEKAELDYECNEVTVLDDLENPVIYAVYNEDIKCIGAHEDTHAIVSQYAQPNSCAVVEGLATCFDKQWKGVSNELCTFLYLEDGKYVSIADMIEDDDFFMELDIDVSYPLMGAFTRYLIEKYGADLYMELYNLQSSWDEAFVNLYGQSLRDVEEGFKETIQDTEYSLEELVASKKVLY